MMRSISCWWRSSHGWTRRKAYAARPEEKKTRTQEEERQSETSFDLRTESYKLFGVDLKQIPGLMAMVLTLFSELGRDMSRWKTAGHFVSWLALCPDTTSVERACCGGVGAECTTGPGTYSAWRHILCITTKARWATICGG